MKKLGPRGAALIKSYEQLRLTAYKPTPNDVWTIGWGSTRNVHEGMTITEDEAELRFVLDTSEAVAMVNNLPVPLSQSAFDALVSLTFNAGPAAIAPDSTIGRSLNVGSYYGAWRGMALWTRQAGKDLRGLAARRAREMSLYMEDPLP